jgi:HTH-type transcriptional regulator, transcriptional repressor of NAD biosynthesis genes
MATITTSARRDGESLIRGLVIGKFYPPHNGHLLLIETAQTHCDQLTIIVCERPDENPTGALRSGWLQRLFPQATVLLIPDRYDPNDSRLWAKLCQEWLGYSPEVVFTSEDYGDTFALHLGSRHVLVDRSRVIVPVSGTAVRAEPLTYWDMLPPPTRGYYCRRVVLVGAESTGKTTLAADLARSLETNWISEFGRELSEQKIAAGTGDTWTSAEFVTIAATQCERENQAAELANRILICDTDAFATTIWHERYMGFRSPEVEAIARNHPRPALYFLTDVTTPFVQDGTRDGEAIREWMHRRFVEELTATQRPYVILRGPREERLTQALSVLESQGLIPSRGGSSSPDGRWHRTFRP